MGILLKMVPGKREEKKKAENLTAEVIGLWSMEIDRAIEWYRTIERERAALGLADCQTDYSLDRNQDPPA